MGLTESPIPAPCTTEQSAPWSGPWGSQTQQWTLQQGTLEQQEDSGRGACRFATVHLGTDPWCMSPWTHHQQNMRADSALLGTWKMLQWKDNHLPIEM